MVNVTELLQHKPSLASTSMNNRFINVIMQRLSVPYTSRYNKKYKIMNIAINSTQKSFGVLQSNEWYTCQEFKWKMEKYSWTSTSMKILFFVIPLCV